MMDLLPVQRAAPLDRLRARYAAAPDVRLLVHRGTCGDAAGAPAILEQLREALPDAVIAETACDGACWAAPAATVIRNAHVHRFARLDRGIPGEIAACLGGVCADDYAGRGERGLTARLGRHDGSLGEALGYGAYATLAAIAGAPAETVVALVQSAVVTDRGGSHADTARAWRDALAARTPRVLVVQVADAEPGVTIARHLVEGDPHRVIEGILIACRGIEADRAVVVLGADVDRSHATLLGAIEEARVAGLLDGSALGSGAVTIEVGAEAPAGIVEHVETLCALTMILEEQPPPTKLLSLAGVPRPGVYEVPVDGATTWAGLLALAGANPSRTQGMIAGGPAYRLVLPEEYEEPLSLRALGSGGIRALPLDADITSVLWETVAGLAARGCGVCRGCTEGAPLLGRFLAQPMAYREETAPLLAILTDDASCGPSVNAGRLVASAVVAFSEAFDS
jgi:NADH:ubiquinone oxidoreductase subunit F (NADH-binding)